MANIPAGTMRDWKDKDIVNAADYKQEREILRTAVNDNDSRTKILEGKNLDSRTTSLEGRMTTAEADIDTVESRATSLESRATTSESNITSLGSRMTTAETNITNRYTKAEVDNSLALKTDKTGDHQGTWNGLTPAQAAEPINGARLDVLEAQNVQSATLANGANTISSIQEAPLKVLSTVGKTVLNLVPPFKYWVKHANATGDGYVLTLNATAGYQLSYIDIPAEPNTVYTFAMSHNSSKITIACRNAQGTQTTLVDSLVTQGTLTTLSDTTTLRLYATNSVAGTFTFTNPFIAKGNLSETFVYGFKGIMNPTIEANGKREVVETTLHALKGVQDELFRDTDGKLKKKTRFKEMALDGSLGWGYSADYVGFKRVRVPREANTNDLQGSYASSKYDGKILVSDGTYNGADYLNIISDGYIYATIADTDSGWGETYTPTADEIKAYFYGWRMYNNDVAGFVPYNGTGTKRWGNIATWTGSSFGEASNTLPTTPAPNYNPYKLVYQLATERVEEVATSGQVVLEEGSNTVELKQGIIVKERANPVLRRNGDYYSIGTIDTGTSWYNSSTKYKNNKIVSIFKNGGVDSQWIVSSDSPTASYGKEYAVILKENFDPTATYYVTYEILPELTAKAEPMQVEYASSLKSLVESNTRQIAEHEGRLDNVIPRVDRLEGLNWINVVPQNGWSSTVQLKYAITTDKRLLFSGVIGLGTTAKDTALFTLPSIARPPSTRVLNALTYNSSTNVGTAQGVGVSSDGTVNIRYTASQQYISFDGLSCSLAPL